jgi:hypothetical protein
MVRSPFVGAAVQRSGVRERRKEGVAAGLSEGTFREEQYLLFLIKE